MAKSQTKYIGLGATTLLIGLIGWFLFSSHFMVEMEGDQYCRGSYSDPCEWKYNITLTTISVYYIQNKNGTEFNFAPEVKDFYNCKKDGRMKATWRTDRSLAPCGIGWREFDWKTPLTSRYKYINKFYKNKKQEFKIVVFKNNPEDDIKFGGEITKDEFDPYFYGVFQDINYTIIKDCKTQIVYDTCSEIISTYLYNNTIINSKTGLEEVEHEFWNKTGRFDCNPQEVEYDCITIGLTTDEIKITCPYNVRCDVLGDDWCMLDCSDGDCNYNALEPHGGGWSFKCIPIKDLTEGIEIKVSDFKKNIAIVKKLSIN